MLNLSVLMEDSAIKFGSNPAFSFANSSFTFSEVNALANNLANGLNEIGIKPGHKVAISCPNCIWFPVIYYAALKTGAVVVPLNILLKADEIKYHLEDCEANTYFCFKGSQTLPIGDFGREAFNKVPGCKNFVLIGEDKPVGKNTYTIQELLEGQSANFDSYTTSADDTAVIIYTSGTTGKPKGAELTHSNLFCNAVLSSDLFSVSTSDVQLVVLPLFHIFGMTVLLNAGLYKAAHSILVPKFEAKEIIEHLTTYKVTLFAGVPTMYWALLNIQHPEIQDEAIIKSLRLCISGGASLPLAVLNGFEKRFGVQILEGYGMSEGAPVVTFNDLRVGKKPGSIGTAVWGVKVKIVGSNGEELPSGIKGELIFKGHNVMKGYYRKPEDTSEVIKNGWMHSGDIAIKDEDGFYFIVDRLKDMIIRGGMNVYPREIEEVIMKHPAVSLVAVIGLPHDKLGEEVKAFIILKEGQKVRAEEIIVWCQERLASYKYPRMVEFCTSLPMTATGKLLKKELRNM
ncbi:long-chain-fatty-acid--CoA ligase [Pedobacter rhodius]|uniref:Long-chain fatty acid--CoA ligase n=1 Tax=Pedobacter rhodius TaxID=3004098 RepID=A0ABT4KYU6_9SPHI|nr:long-chain fatty acid--CoA ligase [Pedobacter sp. SJ11]MCZ4223960.1 long-chain fatty acid--CoA ligase [Pedobacter sp. SJ11]